MSSGSLEPSDKFDVAAARRAAEPGWPAVQPVVRELLEWLRDVDWPVARVSAPFLAGVGEPLAPYLEPILDGDDQIWKYWVLTELLDDPARRE